MCAIRAVLAREGRLDRKDLIRHTAQQLDFARTSRRIATELESALRRAARRGIASNKRGLLSLVAITIEGYDRDFLKQHLLADVRGHEAANPSYRYNAGPQACDYLLWALQRFYERNEERFLHAMWPKFARVLDLDAPPPKTRDKPASGGVEFNEKHPLTLESRAGVWNKDREI